MYWTSRDHTNSRFHSRGMNSSHRAVPLQGTIVTCGRQVKDREVLEILVKAGGANRDRTGDLLVANQTLSQLSYGPA